MVLSVHEHAKNIGAHFADDADYLDHLDLYYQEIVADADAEGQFGNVVERLRYVCAGALTEMYQDRTIESDFIVNNQTDAIFLADLATILLAEWIRP
jgi:hypothetical protein